MSGIARLPTGCCSDTLKQSRGASVGFGSKLGEQARGYQIIRLSTAVLLNFLVADTGVD